MIGHMVAHLRCEETQALTHRQQQFGKAHDPQADLAIRQGRSLDLRQRVAVHDQDIIEKADGQPHHSGQARPIDRDGIALLFDEVCQVDRPEVAGFVGKQRHFAAGIGGLDEPECLEWMGAVDGIQEDESGIAGCPGGLDDAAKDVAGVQAVHHLAGR